MEKITHEEILGVRFDAVSLAEAVRRALTWAQGSSQHHIVTPNPEMILEARKNERFKEVLARADLSLPDGIGIVWASRMNARRAKNEAAIISERVAGVDFMKAFLAELAPLKIPVFLLGAVHGVAEAACHELKKVNRELQIVGTFSGSPRERDFDDIKHKIDRTKPAVLFVAFGAPAQEMWIAKHLKDFPTIKVAVGVGGSFDFIAGAKKRAPLWMQNAGIEWLFRLIQEPRRIKRIFNATIVFPVHYLLGLRRR